MQVFDDKSEFVAPSGFANSSANDTLSPRHPAHSLGRASTLLGRQGPFTAPKLFLHRLADELGALVFAGHGINPLCHAFRQADQHRLHFERRATHKAISLIDTIRDIA